jgi:hypothetical protein
MVYNQEQALHEIFWENTSALSPKYYVYKSRLIKGKLSQKKINEILADNKFVLSQDVLYKKIKK